MNFDGKTDNIYINARVPLVSTEYIYHARLLAFFDYKIDVPLPLPHPPTPFAANAETGFSICCMTR